MAIQEGFIEVTGGKVWYQYHDSNSKKTPVIILHGGPGSSHYSLQGLRVLADERPVLFYDQLGCGKSDRPNDESLWTIDRFVEELGQIRKALSLDDMHILGHSWGTTLAAAYLLTIPEGVKSVIFSSPCLSAPLWAEDQERNRSLLPEDIQATLRECEQNGTTDSEEYQEATTEFNKRFVCRLDPFPEFLKQGAQYKNPVVYNIMWGPSEFHVTGNLKNFDCTARLNEIHIPALYTCGRYDEATPQSTEYFSKLTPKAKFHVFENSAHMPYIEEEAEFLKVIRAFLNSVE
ncbi:proline iminopeptidase-family hydrolase [Bacillus sp. DTU_2020_1000418_1_SI_GHA_SEK_038]|uniref:proline iminopeptidase-family hydrolase n=1 Tax=Bacillus sp. DTU_2020_1000418_1_SI_GHA_SEK_038 TaxID=3077585 RepID=UPI0028EABBA6|nr:proline iminopeptidase-family hydrolase [Bacillus sp. DTU_2020_1000418_1_SI_GHA_SEK_038]WNS73610.1 proline iminopeptidase-family hydrolase [Bacillus sp. DTU_2020_1000418_1_SI_GHA_SEK_038]